MSPAQDFNYRLQVKPFSTESALMHSMQTTSQCGNFIEFGRLRDGSFLLLVTSDLLSGAMLNVAPDQLP